MKRKIFFAAAIIALLFTACQPKTPKNPTSVPSPAPVSLTDTPAPTAVTDPTDTPAPTAVPEPQVLSDVYKNDKRNDVYRLIVPGVTESDSIDEASIRDGYVLLRVRDTDTDNIKLALFPILKPETVIFYEVKNYWNSYKLADKGHVIEILPDSDALNLLSPSFEKVNGVDSGVCYFLGCDSKNRCWHLTEEGYPAYINLFTSESEIFTADSFLRAEALLGEYGDDIFISVTGGPLMSFPAKINLVDKTIDSGLQFVTFPDPVGPYATYYSDCDWYYSKLNDLSTIYTFRKPDRESSFWKCTEKYAISTTYNFTIENDESILNERFDIIDLTNGGQYSSISSEEYEKGTSLTLLALSSDNLVLFLSEKDDKTEAYIWDIGEVSAKANESFRVIKADNFDSEVERTAKAIENKFSVRVFYDDDSLDRLNDGYELVHCYDKFALLSGLSELYNCMDEYPEHFFTETIGNLRESLDFYICDGFRVVDSSQISNPSAYVSYYDNSLTVCVCLTSLRNNFSSTLAHEMMHVMEDRITEYAQSHSKDIMEYWYVNFSSDEYPYFLAYVDENGYEISDTSGTVAGGDPEAWYIDAYSRSNALEDRARIIEYMYMGDPTYFESQHMKDKGKFLITVIREVFPSIAACEEPVLWEKTLGIDDLDFNAYDFNPYAPRG